MVSDTRATAASIARRRIDIGKKVRKSSEEVHKEFREILSYIRYKESRLKVFKRIVLQRWWDECDETLKAAYQINKVLETLQAERAKVDHNFARDELTYSEKQELVKEIDAEIADFIKKKVEADEYADQKEQIVDNTMLFMNDPFEVWNSAPLQKQKAVQHTISSTDQLMASKMVWKY